MIHYKTEDELTKITKSASIVEGAIAAAASKIQPGITTLELDAIAEEYILAQGATPSFKGYKDSYPYACCISVNDAVVHGFPNAVPLQQGDIVSIDVGAYYNGYHGDSAYTLAIGNVAPTTLQLMRVTKQALYVGIEKAIANNRIGDIGFAIWDYCFKKNGYGVVKDLVGHGLGKNLHEDPQVPNTGRRGQGTKLQSGLVIAIEPMINLGKSDVITDADGWTIKTKDGHPAAHYEHNICVKKGKALILSSFVRIEQAEKDNEYLNHSYLN